MKVEGFAALSAFIPPNPPEKVLDFVLPVTIYNTGRVGMKTKTMVPVSLEDMQTMVTTLERALVLDEDKSSVLRILKAHLQVRNDLEDESYHKEKFIAP